MKLATVTATLAVVLLSVDPIMGQNMSFAAFNETVESDFDGVDGLNDTMMMDGEDMLGGEPTMEDDMEPATMEDGETIEGGGGDNMMMESTVGPTDGMMMDDTHSDMMMNETETMMPSEEENAVETDTDTGADSSRETNPPQDLATDGYTCSVGGVETDTARCTEYKNSLSNIECGCYYFCEGGSLVRCMDDTETFDFSCGDGQVYECFDDPAVVSAAGDEATEDALHSLYATAMTALAALICIA